MLLLVFYLCLFSFFGVKSERIDRAISFL